MPAKTNNVGVFNKKNSFPGEEPCEISTDSPCQLFNFVYCKRFLSVCATENGLVSDLSKCDLPQQLPISKVLTKNILQAT